MEKEEQLQRIRIILKSIRLLEQEILQIRIELHKIRQSLLQDGKTLS